jgi:hypothetical protein
MLRWSSALVSTLVRNPVSSQNNCYCPLFSWHQNTIQNEFLPSSFPDILRTKKDSPFCICSFPWVDRRAWGSVTAQSDQQESWEAHWPNGSWHYRFTFPELNQQPCSRWPLRALPNQWPQLGGALDLIHEKVWIARTVTMASAQGCPAPRRPEIVIHQTVVGFMSPGTWQWRGQFKKQRDYLLIYYKCGDSSRGQTGV